MWINGLVSFISSVGIAVALNPAFSAEMSKLPSSPKEIYSCLSGKSSPSVDCPPLGTNNSRSRSINLQCYRECVTFCQDGTGSIEEEQDCIRSQCLEGGAWGCG